MKGVGDALTLGRFHPIFIFVPPGVKYSLIDYKVMHTILVLFQAVTLNVAFNSHNKALLTIMMSNNVSTSVLHT